MTAANSTSNSASMVRCATCGTSFSANDAAQLAAHAGHPLEHIQQG
ncbi:MAG TPA: hypothetical protein VMG99_01555 [Thermoplasmata archaeon]|jgi:hypothetical protein|nr:hypothetical protein [Thermoplasmata archaeon]